MRKIRALLDWLVALLIAFILLYVLLAPPVLAFHRFLPGRESIAAFYDPLLDLTMTRFGAPLLWYFNDVWHLKVMWSIWGPPVPQMSWYVVALYVLVGVLMASAFVFPFWRWIYARRGRVLKGHRILIAVDAILCGLALIWGIHALSMPDRHAEEKYNEWCNELTAYITPRLCAYYQLHPERFKPVGKGEEIEIEGLVDFIRADGFFQSPHRCRIRGNTLRDPWGDPIHFVQDLNMDGFIDARGQRRPVADLAVYDDVGQRVDYDNEHRLGICKDNVRGIENPWESIFVLSYHHAKWRP